MGGSRFWERMLFLKRLSMSQPILKADSGFEILGEDVVLEEVEHIPAQPEG
jgi:hypothetical protein